MHDFYKFPASTSSKRRASNNRLVSCTVKRIHSWRKLKTNYECTKQRAYRVNRLTEVTLNVRDFPPKSLYAHCWCVCMTHKWQTKHIPFCLGTYELLFPSNQTKIISKKLNAFIRMKCVQMTGNVQRVSLLFFHFPFFIFLFSFCSHEMFCVKWQMQFSFQCATPGQRKTGKMMCWNRPLVLLYDFWGNGKRNAEKKWA